MKQSNKPIKRTSINIPHQTYLKLKVYCKSQGYSVPQWSNITLLNALNQLTQAKEQQ